jgi:hypothetical protein
VLHGHRYPWADKGDGSAIQKGRGRGPAHGSLSLACPAAPSPFPPCPVVAAARIIFPPCERGRTATPSPRPRRLLLSSSPPPTAAARARLRMAAAPSSLVSSHLSRLADLRRAAAPATPTVPQQLRVGFSRRRAQRVVAMAGSGKVRRRLRRRRCLTVCPCGVCAHAPASFFFAVLRRRQLEVRKCMFCFFSFTRLGDAVYR